MNSIVKRKFYFAKKSTITLFEFPNENSFAVPAGGVRESGNQEVSIEKETSGLQKLSMHLKLKRVNKISVLGNSHKRSFNHLNDRVRHSMSIINCLSQIQKCQVL